MNLLMNINCYFMIDNEEDPPPHVQQHKGHTAGSGGREKRIFFTGSGDERQDKFII